MDTGSPELAIPSALCVFRPLPHFDLITGGEYCVRDIGDVKYFLDTFLPVAAPPRGLDHEHPGKLGPNDEDITEPKHVLSYPGVVIPFFCGSTNPGLFAAESECAFCWANSHGIGYNKGEVKNASAD